MKKDKKFLKELEDNLIDISEQNKKNILKKYENIIKTEKENKKKITVIIKELGNPKEIAQKEISLLGKESLSFRIKNKIDKMIKSYKDKKAEKENNIDKKLKNNRDELKKKLKNEKKQLKKDLKEEKKKIKKEIEKDKLKKEKKNKDEKAPNKLKSFFTFLTKDRSIDISKKKEEKENKLIETIDPDDIKENPVTEVIEDVKDEISDVSEIVAEKHIFESKSTRIKRIVLKTLGVLLTILLLFIWLWVTVVFIASLFAYLDGVKFIGINIALFGIDLLVLWIVIMVNRAIFKKKKGWKLNVIVTVISIIIIAFGIVTGLKQVSEIETVKDVSIKYSMTNKLNTYELSSDKSQKFTLTFNSNYNTQYTLNYDDTLKNKIKVEVKYYECYYDYYIKETSNSAYISLKLDDRDRLSVYIDDLKEGKVFDNDELSRYSVKISVNPNDAGRLVILD